MSDTRAETLEKPLFTSGRLSRISMILEEEYENYSDDDEISIEVPDTLSPSNNTISVPSNNTISVPNKTTISVPINNTTFVSSNTTISVPSNNTISIPSNNTISIPSNTTISVPSNTTISVPSNTTISVPGNNMKYVPSIDMITVPDNNLISVPSNTMIAAPDNNMISVPRKNMNAVSDAPSPGNNIISVPSNITISVPSNNTNSVPNSNMISVPDTPSPSNNMISVRNTLSHSKTDISTSHQNQHSQAIVFMDNDTQKVEASNLDEYQEHNLNINSHSITNNSMNTITSHSLDYFTEVKQTTSDDVTNNHPQNEGCTCNQTESLTGCNTTVLFNSESLTSMAPSYLDESFHGNDDFSFTSESVYSDEISDDVFRDEADITLDKSEIIEQDVKLVTIQNDLKSSSKTYTSKYESIQHGGVSHNTECIGEGNTNHVGQSKEHTDIKVKVEDNACLWKEVFSTGKRQSVCDNLSFTEQANTENVDSQALKDDVRAVSASNVILEADVDSPVTSYTLDGNHRTFSSNNKSQTKQYSENRDGEQGTRRTCSHHNGNYRKIKLEGRRRQRLSLDGLQPKPDIAKIVNDNPDINSLETDVIYQDKTNVGENVSDDNHGHRLLTVDDLGHVNKLETDTDIDVNLVRRSNGKGIDTTSNHKTFVPALKTPPVLHKRHKMMNMSSIRSPRAHDVDTENSLNIIDKISLNEVDCKEIDINGNGEGKNLIRLQKNQQKPLPNINTPKHKPPDHSDVPSRDKNHNDNKIMKLKSEEKQTFLKPMKRKQISDNFTGSESDNKIRTSRDQMDCNLNVTNGADEYKPETTGNEIFMSDDNQSVINTGKQSLHAGKISQYNVERYQYTIAVNSNNMKNMDNNFDTKSLLLPIVHETGNCAIKSSAREMVENDSNLHYCQTKQLSLPVNDKKKNAINQPKHSIINSRKVLNKRGTLEDVYGTKVVQHSFARLPLQDYNARLAVVQDRKEADAARRLNLTDEEKYQTKVKTFPVVGGIKHERNITNISADISDKLNTKMSKKVVRTFERNMSAGFRGPAIERTESNSSSHSLCGTPSFTDTARLRSIRKWLKLPADKYDVTSETRRKETELIIHQILDNVLKEVCKACITQARRVIHTHRCTIKDEEGDEILGCLLQTTLERVDPSVFYCDVVDPLDVSPVTKKHEHLISNIIKISSRYSHTKSEFIVNIPISHWYVEPWEEVIIRRQDINGHWKDASDSVDIVKIEDTNKVVYGVRHVITDICSLAVITRPQTTTVTLTDYDNTIEAISDHRVKMHMFASCIQKHISFQVIPVSLKNLEDFQASSGQRKMAVVASSPLIIVDVKDHDPESLAFDVPYVVNHPKYDGSLNSRRKSSVHQITSFSKPYGMTTSGTWKPSNMQTRLGMTSSLLRSNPNHLLFHLVQLDDDDNVRIKLLENTDGTNDVTSVHCSNGGTDCDNKDNATNEYRTVNFSLYDRYARVIAVETKGAILYSEVQNVTTPFVNFLVKHRVKITLSQDPRNVYSILFTAVVEHPHREEKFSLQKTYENFKSVDMKEIFLYEGDVIAISFRGNVSVPDSEKLIYSFHGCRGVRRHFDLQVNNPARQRSLKTYHGAIQVFKYKSPRYSALDKTLAPCEKNGWELSLEFPLILPKYLKTTPTIINKAPVSLKFQEPLTLDFVRAMCTELSKDWWVFAKALGMGHARVQALKQHHKNQSSDTAVMDVIINWMKIQTISQDKVSPVINALRMCNKWKLASELAHRHTAQRVRKSRVVRDKHLQNVFSIVSQNKTAALKWREIIRNLFIDNGGHIDDVIRKMDQQYKDNYTKCLEALKHWKSEIDDPSVWTLIDVLRSSGCNIAAGKNLLNMTSDGVGINVA
ncbi:hypothetical protein ACF0H5_021808 [Mactra antiquata]